MNLVGKASFRVAHWLKIIKLEIKKWYKEEGIRNEREAKPLMMRLRRLTEGKGWGINF